MKKYFLKLSMIIILAILVCSNYTYNVKASKDPIAPEDEKKLIYLTFDDGPSVLTEKILDTLKKCDVPATFFLIGNQIQGNEKTIIRMQEEGHGIGLHTYSHNYNKIYSSRKNFIAEMFKTQNIIYDLIGERPTIIRFPFGSSGKLTKAYLDELHKNNFTVYDWNIDMKDGINCHTPVYNLYRFATNTKNIENPVILLMHCDSTHKNTCAALSKVIEFYKKEGYEFKVINSSTPEMYFKIRN